MYNDADHMSKALNLFVCSHHVPLCTMYYPARARSARARRARALRALGLLLADGALTVGWGKTFWGVGRVPLTKTGVTRKRKVAQ